MSILLSEPKFPYTLLKLDELFKQSLICRFTYAESLDECALFNFNFEDGLMQFNYDSNGLYLVWWRVYSKEGYVTVYRDYYIRRGDPEEKVSELGEKIIQKLREVWDNLPIDDDPC